MEVDEDLNDLHSTVVLLKAGSTYPVLTALSAFTFYCSSIKG